MDFQQSNKTYDRWRIAGYVTAFAIVVVTLFGLNIILSLQSGHFFLWPPWLQGPIDLTGLLCALLWCFGICKNKAWLMLASLALLWISTAYECIIDISMYCDYLKGPKNHRYTAHALDFGMLVMFRLPLTALHLICCISATVCYLKIKKATRKMEAQSLTVTYDLPKCDV